MGAKISPQMLKALRLVKAGATGRDAARKAGVREESLYRNPDYKAWKAAQASAPPT